MNEPKLIIPEEFKNRTLAPIAFPLVPDADTILDQNQVEIAKIADKVPSSEAFKLAKLLASAPEAFELLGKMYGLLGSLEARNIGVHATEKETPELKEGCPLCQAEALLNKVV